MKFKVKYSIDQITEADLVISDDGIKLHTWDIQPSELTAGTSRNEKFKKFVYGKGWPPKYPLASMDRKLLDKYLQEFKAQRTNH